MEKNSRNTLMLCRAFSSLPLPFILQPFHFVSTSFTHLINRMRRTTAVSISHLLHPIRRTCSQRERQSLCLRPSTRTLPHLDSRSSISMVVIYPWLSSMSSRPPQQGFHTLFNMATLGWSSLLLLLVRRFELISQLCQVLLANLKDINHVAR
jgi:hypothetical protein